MHPRKNGFSLIELLIVVAIILIIAAIAIPNLLRAKIAANQASAVGALRTMTSAEQMFSSTYSDGFSLTLAQLGGPAGGAASCANAELIDEVLSTAPNQKSGYKFTFTPTAPVALTAGIPAACGASGDVGFSISSTPVSVSTGTASYCVDQTGVVRVNSAGTLIAPTCSLSGFPPLQ